MGLLEKAQQKKKTGKKSSTSEEKIEEHPRGVEESLVTEPVGGEPTTDRPRSVPVKAKKTKTVSQSDKALKSKKDVAASVSGEEKLSSGAEQPSADVGGLLSKAKQVAAETTVASEQSTGEAQPPEEQPAEAPAEEPHADISPAEEPEVEKPIADNLPRVSKKSKKAKAVSKAETVTKPEKEVVESVSVEETQQVEEQPSADAEGLLSKAKQVATETIGESKKVPVPHPSAGKDIEVVQERHEFGWKQMGSMQIVFDHNRYEYRFELIEPELNLKEKELKKELSHLFKMLADVESFDLTQEEKEKLLEDTLEQIIVDNNITFGVEPESKKGLLSLKKSKDPVKKAQKATKKQTKKDKKQKEPKKPGKGLLRRKGAQEQADAAEQELVDEGALDEHSKDKLFYHLFREFLGYGRIDILMHDDGIEDISCDGPETPIFIHHRKYEAIETNIYFEDEEELNSFIVRLCQISGKQISIYSPIVDGKLPDGSRLQATLARTVTKGSTFTIRKFKDNPLTPVDLIDYHSLSAEMAAYFWMAIEDNASILFCGGTASGKTTALNALSLFIPSSHKIISIEDTREVNLPHKNWIAGTTRKGFKAAEENKTGKDIDMFDLIRAALRQRPRVIIVGEVRGREAYSLFQAMATGHTSYATVHASDIHTLIQRLENPPISLPRALLTSLDVIVFQNAVSIGGKMVRRMTGVTEIIKLDSDTNQLIFMAPFTWTSKVDDLFESSGTSKILNRIRQQNDWSEERLEQELANRVCVLEWMLKKDIRSYIDVGRIISEYAKYPDQVLKRAKEELKTGKTP